MDGIGTAMDTTDSLSRCLSAPAVAPFRGFRPVIVWAINDAMSGPSTRRQMQSFVDCGYGGVMIMPWGGLPYAFMSDEWLAGVGGILRGARELDLDVWLWDEWCFGSGPAAGRVTREVAHRAKTLHVAIDIILEPGESIELPVPPRTVVAGCFAADKFGNPAGPVQPMAAPTGGRMAVGGGTRRRVVVVCWQFVSGMQHTTRSHGRFLDPGAAESACDIYTCEDAAVWSVDMLKPAATRQYLAEIHQRYYDRFPEYFGTTLKGFFYDEPKASSLRPWTDDFLPRFGAIKGYDLGEHLVAMLVDYRMEGACFNDRLRPEAVKQAEADYHDVWTSLLAESFYGEVQQWCRAHGVISTGHPVGDDGLAVDQVLSGGGVYFKNMARSDMPGADVIWDRIEAGRFCDSARLPASRAAVSGAQHAMTETFAVFGHGVHVDQMRYVMENQIVRGVNRFFNKLANYDPVKSLHFHPPELSGHNPVIARYGRLLHDRIQMLAGLMSAGRPLPAIGLYVPVGSYYRRDERLAAEVQSWARRLAYSQLEFDYLWDGDIPALRDEGDCMITPGGRQYDVLVVPAHARPDGAVAAGLARLARAPDRVLLCPPCAGALADLAAPVVDIDGFIGRCRRRNPCVAFTSAARPVTVRGRMLDDGAYVLLLLNESRERVSLAVQVLQGRRLLEADPTSGRLTDLTPLDGAGRVELAFEPTESRLLRAVADDRVAAPRPPGLDEERAMVLTAWELELPDGRVVDVAHPLPSWQELGWGEYSGCMRYRARFDWPGHGRGASLCLGTLCYAATVWLDGRKLGDCVFTPFRLAVEELAAGGHLLEIAVLNTPANEVFGSEQRIARLAEQGAFKGTYAPIYRGLDMRKLRSGLLGPATLTPRKT